MIIIIIIETIDFDSSGHSSNVSLINSRVFRHIVEVDDELYSSIFLESNFFVLVAISFLNNQVYVAWVPNQFIFALRIIHIIPLGIVGYELCLKFIL